jgi:hypothetical protein
MAGKTVADVKTGFRGRAIVKGGTTAASRTVGLLGGILSFAVSEGVITANPVRGVKRPADNRREVRLTAGQYKALGDALAAAEAEGENPSALLMNVVRRFMMFLPTDVDCILGCSPAVGTDVARVLRVQIVVLSASTVSEIDAAFAALAREHAQALFVAGDTFFSAAASNLPLSRRATACLRVMARTNMSKLAGL